MAALSVETAALAEETPAIADVVVLVDGGHISIRAVSGELHLAH